MNVSEFVGTFPSRPSFTVSLIGRIDSQLSSAMWLDNITGVLCRPVGGPRLYSNGKRYILTVRDPSCCLVGSRRRKLVVHVFARPGDEPPDRLVLGCMVRIEHVKLEMWNEQVDGRIFNCSYLRVVWRSIDGSWLWQRGGKAQDMLPARLAPQDVAWFDWIRVWYDPYKTKSPTEYETMRQITVTTGLSKRPWIGDHEPWYPPADLLYPLVNFCSLFAPNLYRIDGVVVELGMAAGDVATPAARRVTHVWLCDGTDSILDLADDSVYPHDDGQSSLCALQSDLLVKVRVQDAACSRVLLACADAVQPVDRPPAQHDDEACVLAPLCVRLVAVRATATLLHDEHTYSMGMAYSLCEHDRARVERLQWNDEPAQQLCSRLLANSSVKRAVLTCPAVRGQHKQTMFAPNDSANATDGGHQRSKRKFHDTGICKGSETHSKRPANGDRCCGRAVERPVTASNSNDNKNKMDGIVNKEGNNNRESSTTHSNKNMNKNSHIRRAEGSVPHTASVQLTDNCNWGVKKRKRNRKRRNRNRRRNRGKNKKETGVVGNSTSIKLTAGIVDNSCENITMTEGEKSGKGNTYSIGNLTSENGDSMIRVDRNCSNRARDTGVGKRNGMINGAGVHREKGDFVMNRCSLHPDDLDLVVLDEINADVDVNRNAKSPEERLHINKINMKGNTINKRCREDKVMVYNIDECIRKHNKTGICGELCIKDDNSDAMNDCVGNSAENEVVDVGCNGSSDSENTVYLSSDSISPSVTPHHWLSYQSDVDVESQLSSDASSVVIIDDDCDDDKQCLEEETPLNVDGLRPASNNSYRPSSNSTILSPESLFTSADDVCADNAAADGVQNKTVGSVVLSYIVDECGQIGNYGVYDCVSPVLGSVSNNDREVTRDGSEVTSIGSLYLSDEATMKSNHEDDKIISNGYNMKCKITEMQTFNNDGNIYTAGIHVRSSTPVGIVPYSDSSIEDSTSSSFSDVLNDHNRNCGSVESLPETAVISVHENEFVCSPSIDLKLSGSENSIFICTSADHSHHNEHYQSRVSDDCSFSISAARTRSELSDVADNQRSNTTTVVRLDCDVVCAGLSHGDLVCDARTCIVGCERSGGNITAMDCTVVSSCNKEQRSACSRTPSPSVALCCMNATVNLYAATFVTLVPACGAPRRPLCSARRTCGQVFLVRCRVYPAVRPTRDHVSARALCRRCASVNILQGESATSGGAGEIPAYMRVCRSCGGRVRVEPSVVLELHDGHVSARASLSGTHAERFFAAEFRDGNDFGAFRQRVADVLDSLCVSDSTEVMVASTGRSYVILNTYAVNVYS